MKKSLMTLVLFLFTGFRTLLYASTQPAAIKIYFTQPGTADPSTSEVVNSGTGIDDALVALIGSVPAGTTFYVAIYELDDQNVIAAINAAASRGAYAKVITNKTATLASLSASVQKKSREATPEPPGPDTGDMHNKFVVVKDSAVWTGSYNFTSSGLNQQDNNSVVIYSSGLAGIYEQEWQEMWLYSAVAPLRGFGDDKLVSAVPGNGQEIVLADGTKLTPFFTPYASPSLVRSAIEDEIEAATEGIYFCLAWFTETNIRDALIAAHARGVEVRGVIDDDYSTNGSVYYDLKEAGIPVVWDSRETSFGSGLMHHKFCVIDPASARGRLITGSANWSNNGTTASDNDENIVIIESPAVSSIYFQEFLRLYTAAGGTRQTAGELAVHDVVIYPSPASSRAVIGFNISLAVESVKLKVYTLSGEEVCEIVPDILYPGFYNETEWQLDNSSGRDVASGLYMILVEASTPDGKFFADNKMCVIRE